MEDLLLKEISEARSAKANVRQLEWDEGFKFGKTLGQCPSFICKISQVERAFVQAGIESPKDDWKLNIPDPSTFKDSILSTPEFVSWYENRPQSDSYNFKAGVQAFKSATFWDALREFQAEWTKLHPCFKCDLSNGFNRVLIISGTIDVKRQKI